ncbi:hypothetical protein UFOVP75_2 [uncultured Caudovirales phage]|uniref:Uncharacterized protein n=1 Tax=uncultured Caudovirales phage TaxID=2100421 RepID=A0A6J5L3C2_9CAUD|nr:hypothetical protein UFOVP75_2 [uncultured Caudovirales phage]
MTTVLDTLTPATRALFVSLVADAPDWNGEPLLNISKEQRGNLSDLKMRGLVRTVIDDSGFKPCQFVQFTAQGRTQAIAASLKGADYFNDDSCNRCVD